MNTNVSGPCSQLKGRLCVLMLITHAVARYGMCSAVKLGSRDRCTGPFANERGAARMVCVSWCSKCRMRSPAAIPAAPVIDDVGALQIASGRVISRSSVDARPVCGFGVFATAYAVRLGVAASLACAIVALAGCATAVDGHPLPAKAAPPPEPPVAVAALDRLLLTAGEIKALTVSGVTGEEPRKSMLQHGRYISETACAAVDNTAEESVYAGSGWTAVRRQVFAEPGDDYDHFIDQAVVSFPAARDAADFFTASARMWADCSNQRYRYTKAGEPELAWTVGPVANVDGILSTTKTQEGVDGWNCQRALTSANNVVIDVVACSYSQDQATAINIARRIATKMLK